MFNEWPPPAHRARIDLYEENQRLFKSGLNEVLSARVDRRLGKSHKELAETCATILDYPRLISLVCSNLLVGEPPLVFFKEREFNEAFQQIATDSGLWPVLLEASLSASYRGDAVLMARRREDQAVVIESKPAKIWFPELDQNHSRDIRKHVFGWAIQVDGRKLIRFDEYAKGECRRTVWEQARDWKVGRQVTGREAEEIIGGPELVKTGISLPPVVHIPNLREDDEFFGSSDYTEGLKTLFSSVCNRISQIDLILDMHAEPKMAGPPMEDANGEVDMMAMQYFPVQGGSSEYHPRYITRDLQLDAALKALEETREEIHVQSEISRVLVGWVNGARYDSAQAFKLQFVPTLAKTGRKRTYFDPGFKQVARMAVALKLRLPLEKVSVPMVQWQDGLPRDERTAAEVEEMRLRSGTSSVMSSIQRIDGCDEVTAQAEMDQISLEQFERAKLAPRGVQNIGQRAEEQEIPPNGG